MRILRNQDQLGVEVASEAETELVGAAMAAILQPGQVVGLVGTLGAGKTRLVRALARAMGVDEDAVSSPTFVLIHEYPSSPPLYHFDTYRLPDSDAFESLGASEYLYGDGICLVEWADRVAEMLPEETLWLFIEATGPTQRRFRFEGGKAGGKTLDAIEGALNTFG